MHLDPVLVFLKPFFHPFCVMDSQVVDDEEDFPFPVVDQADDRAVEAFVVPLGAKLRRRWASDFAAASSAHPISGSLAFARAFGLG